MGKLLLFGSGKAKMQVRLRLAFATKVANFGCACGSCKMGRLLVFQSGKVKLQARGES